MEARTRRLKCGKSRNERESARARERSIERERERESARARERAIERARERESERERERERERAESSSEERGGRCVCVCGGKFRKSGESQVWMSWEIGRAGRVNLKKSGTSKYEREGIVKPKFGKSAN